MSKREILIIFILIIIALIRFLFFIPKAPVFDQAIGKNIELDGQVVDDPDIRLNNQHLNVKLKNSDITILVLTNREKEINYGDSVKVRGVLEEPENFITVSGKEFNYQRYLANQDIYFLIKKANVEIISKGNGNFIKSFLFKIKRSFIKNINQIIPPPESDLASGLILGARGGFEEETRQEFIETGTIHIVALSGYNVSIVSENVMKVFGQIFSQTISIILGIIVVLLFIIMTGASSTAIRAGIMAIIMLLGRMTGRNYLAGRALVIAGLLMIAYDPRILVDMSFQLSFIATGGVLFITPKILNYFKFLPLRFGFREMVASTMAATIAVLPILIYLTGLLSLVSIPANILILLFIPTAMLLVFLTGILGFFSSFLAILFGFISNLILAYILFIIHFFASFPNASLTFPSFPLLFVILIYLLILWWIFGKKPIDKSSQI